MNPEPGRVIRQPAGGPGVTRFATRGDHRLSYESSGADDGIPILALHDLLADRGQFRPLGDALPEGGFRITLPDARGHGASPTISGRAYPTRELVADTLAVLDAEGLSAVHIAAIGWGAGIALGLAAAAPERVASLVLAAPYIPDLLAGHADSELRQENARHGEMLRDAAAAAEKGQIDRALDLFLGMRRGENWREGLPKPRLGAIRRAAGNLGPLLTGMSANPFEPEDLGRMAVPAMIVLGDDASVFERELANGLAARLPLGRLARIAREPDRESALGSGWIPAIARALVAATR